MSPKQLSTTQVGHHYLVLLKFGYLGYRKNCFFDRKLLRKKLRSYLCSRIQLSEIRYQPLAREHPKRVATSPKGVSNACSSSLQPMPLPPWSSSRLLTSLFHWVRLAWMFDLHILLSFFCFTFLVQYWLELFVFDWNWTYLGSQTITFGDHKSYNSSM